MASFSIISAGLSLKDGLENLENTLSNTDYVVLTGFGVMLFVSEINQTNTNSHLKITSIGLAWYNVQNIAQFNHLINASDDLQLLSGNCLELEKMATFTKLSSFIPMLFVTVAFAIVGYIISCVLTGDKGSSIEHVGLGLAMGLLVTYLHLTQVINMLFFSHMVQIAEWHVGKYVEYASSCLSCQSSPLEYEANNCAWQAHSQGHAILAFVDRIQSTFCKLLLIGVSYF